MKKISAISLLLFLGYACSSAYGQTTADSVWVEGRVTDAVTGQSEAICEVQLLQENEIRATAFCDAEGYYSIGWMPVGIYTLSVLSAGKSLYYAEFRITENAMVNIALIHDTTSIRTLKSVTVTDNKVGMGGRQITSPDDPRLWNFNNNPELWDSGPASANFSGSPSCHIALMQRRQANKMAVLGQPLYTWRPVWLDAPFPKQASTKTKTKTKKVIPIHNVK